MINRRINEAGFPIEANERSSVYLARIWRSFDVQMSMRGIQSTDRNFGCFQATTFKTFPMAIVWPGMIEDQWTLSLMFDLRTSTYKGQMKIYFQQHQALSNNNCDELKTVSTYELRWTRMKLDSQSSLSVNLPICGKSLNGSRQIIPPRTSNRTMAIWSCLMNLGLIVDFSLVFLSIRQIKACRELKGSVLRHVTQRCDRDITDTYNLSDS